MAISSNSPGLSYISWSNCSISYVGNSYIIQDSYTFKKYVYWNKNTPYQFDVSDKLLDEIGGRYLVIVNDRGIYSIPPLSDDIKMNFTEEGNPSLIATQIQGFHQSEDNNNEKFATVEKSIEGINATVGSIKQDNESTKKQITTLEQTDKSIKAEIETVSTEFNKNKANDELRENINNALINFNSVLGNYLTDMSKYMEDNSISNSEKSDITTYKSKLELQKTNVNTQIDLVLTALQQNGETDNYNLLNNEKTSFNNAVETLTTIVDNAIIDGIITPTEITNITTAFGFINTRSLVLKNTLDQIILLGVGGTIVEELTKISAESNKITLSVSKVERTLKNNLNIKKSQLQTQIDDLYTSIDVLNNVIDKIIEDRTVSEEEKTKLNQQIANVDTELKDVAVEYEEIISNENLTSSTKEILDGKYADLIYYKQNIVNTTNTAFTDGNLTDLESNNIVYAMSEFKNQADAFHQSLAQALDEIQTNDWHKKLEEAKSTYNKEITELNNKLNDAIFDINGAMSSGLIDSMEKEDLLSDVNQLEREKIIVNNRFNKWYSDPFLLGEDKSNYKIVYDTFIREYNNLINLINSIANSNTLISEIDRTNVNSAKNKLNNALSDFYSSSDKVVNIISINETKYLNDTLRRELIDANSAINSLEDTLNNTFKDGIIDRIELSDINTMLIQIEKEKDDINNKFNEIYNNVNLK